MKRSVNKIAKKSTQPKLIFIFFYLLFIFVILLYNILQKKSTLFLDVTRLNIGAYIRSCEILELIYYNYLDVQLPLTDLAPAPARICVYVRGGW